MYLVDLIAELDAAALVVDHEGEAVAAGDVEREPILLAAVERLDVVTKKLRATLVTEL